MLLKNKNILVGVTGSIAAYKSAFLVRLLIKQGANVKVVMSSAAAQFIAPVTLSTLSKNPVFSDFYKSDSGEWNNHVELALWADAFVIAPVSANTLAKMASGLCDNILLATFLSAKCPVFFAPAMDLDMFLHKSTQRNIQTIVADGAFLIDAESGELASGLDGKGRMAEPEHILNFLIQHFEQSLLSK